MTDHSIFINIIIYQSLMGLMSRLQTLETTFASILMESAMKLAALTDAGIFLLVETTEGRRFVGNDHLCRAYNSGDLRNTGHDIQLSCNLASSSLQEKSHPPPPLPPPHFPENVFLNNFPLNSRPSLLGKRPSPASSSTSPSPKKESKLFGEEDRRNGLDDDDAILIEDDDEIDDLREGDIRSFKGGEVAALELDDSFCFDVSWIGDQVPNAKKLEFLRSARRLADLERNSVLRKVLDSALYELGKEAGLRYPLFGSREEEASTKSYLDEISRRWFQLLPNLASLRDEAIDYSDIKKESFKVYVRSTLRRRFNEGIRKRKRDLGDETTKKQQQFFVIDVNKL